MTLNKLQNLLIQLRLFTFVMVVLDLDDLECHLVLVGVFLCRLSAFRIHLQVILLGNIQILILMRLRNQEILFLLLMLFGSRGWISSHKVLDQAVSGEPRIFICQQVFDVGHPNWLINLKFICLNI